MTTIYDVPSSKLIAEVSKELKKVKAIKPPEWSAFVKTGVSREKSPVQPDWWYTRAASVLRKVHIKGPIGIPRLKQLYGTAANRGVRPERKKAGSGAVMKNILVQLEAAELVKKTSKGRIATTQGISLLDKKAHMIKKKIPELKKY